MKKGSLLVKRVVNVILTAIIFIFVGYLLFTLTKF